MTLRAKIDVGRFVCLSGASSLYSDDCSCSSDEFMLGGTALAALAKTRARIDDGLVCPFAADLNHETKKQILNANNHIE